MDSTTCTHQVQDCDAIQRLLISLKYYNLLDIKNDKNNQKIFENYMNEVYKNQIYHDYHHLQKYHSNELQEIKNTAITRYGILNCHEPQCKYSDTVNYNIEIGEADNDNLRKYVDTLDDLHLYLFHPHQTCSGDGMIIGEECNNCNLWREICYGQENKIKELESEIERIKDMNNNIKEYEQELSELKQLNKDQLNKINDMKHENDALKQQSVDLRKENKSLHDDVKETKEKGRKALNVINKLKKKVIKIQNQIQRESAEVIDSKNPWLWILRMT